MAPCTVGFRSTKENPNVYLTEGLPGSVHREAVYPRRREKHVAGLVTSRSELDRLNGRTRCRERCGIRRLAREFANICVPVAKSEAPDR